MNSIFHRRSIRRFTDQKVSDAQIDKLLKAAMAAPSACNDQQWEFYVVRNPQMIEDLSKTSPYASCAKRASVLIVPCYHSKGGFAPEYGQINLALAVQNLMLEADEAGLGSVCLGVAPNEERMAYVRNILDLKGDLEPFAIIPVGYPDETPKPKDNFTKSKVHYIE